MTEPIDQARVARPLIATVTRDGINAGLSNLEILNLIHERCADPNRTIKNEDGSFSYFDEKGKAIRSNKATIAWYRNDMKNGSTPKSKGNSKAKFLTAYGSIPEEKKSEVLLNLACANLELLINKGDLKPTVLAFPDFFPVEEVKEQPVAPVEAPASIVCPNAVIHDDVPEAPDEDFNAASAAVNTAADADTETKSSKKGSK